MTIKGTDQGKHYLGVNTLIVKSYLDGQRAREEDGLRKSRMFLYNQLNNAPFFY